MAGFGAFRVADDNLAGERRLMWMISGAGVRGYTYRVDQIQYGPDGPDVLLQGA